MHLGITAKTFSGRVIGYVQEFAERLVRERFPCDLES